MYCGRQLTLTIDSCSLVFLLQANISNWPSRKQTCPSTITSFRLGSIHSSSVFDSRTSPVAGSTEGVVPAGEVWLPQMEIAFETGEIAQGGDDGRALAIPIKVRGQVIGVLDASKSTSSEAWSEEEIGLLRTLTEQLGTALEGARLYQDTQRRATRERLVGEVTARMRESLDVERVLQAAVREFGKSLGADEVKIRLTADS